mmetsp:Transcript_1837/g.2896  ORF Transcript_1837/g.2896 Transcript_1837/m.2896 type:complete len:137 (+) Transcript_1837:208-618(+)
METVADEQHFRFQTYKHSLSAEERLKSDDIDVKKGFYTCGLFAYCRHPNYFAEQSMWVCVYLFSITPKESDFINWTIIGPILLILLFQGSMRFGESISASKYPLYKEYQRRIPQCIPSLAIIVSDLLEGKGRKKRS